MRPGKILREVLNAVWRKPATLNYPLHKAPMCEGFRGKIRHAAKNCIGCRMCMRDCPAFAIEIKPAGEKKFIAEIDYSKCICCCQCVDGCPRKALEVGPEFELAQLEASKLKEASRHQDVPVKEIKGQAPSG
jgi:formate hydrogenlyase subunit 6/NADH:ubiquinone oxidoreductase subunit I